MDVLCSFNTSHVTLYQITRYLKQLIKRFQYISCYSLSRYLVLVLLSWKRFNTSHVTLYQAKMEALFTNVTRFNTSHVTLYLQNVDYGKMAKGFQYISCYSLSSQYPEGQVGICAWFQYISCYSLSRPVYDTIVREMVSIHLMLLFISSSYPRQLYLSVFQYISCYSLSNCGEKIWL